MDNHNKVELGLEAGRIPPQATELEEAVLGSILLETSAITRCKNLLRTESFYKDSHQKIYNTCQLLHKKNEPVDILTVTNTLKSKGELEIVGGAYYITQLTNRVASTANIEYHARIIHQKFIQREIIRTCSELTRNSYNDQTDVFDLADSFQANSISINELLYSGRLNINHISEVIPKSMSDLGQRIANARSKKLAGLPTPFNALNKLTGGWRNSDLIVLAGRPSMGKTALALAFSSAISQAGYNVSIFSLEMSDTRLVDRLLIAGSGVDAQKFKNGFLSDREQEQVINYSESLNNENIWIDDSPYASIDYIRSVTRIQKNKGKVDMIIIDYLQLAKPDTRYRGNREGEIAEISRNLKGLAKELNVPVIILAQLNRQVESRPNKKPILSDLRESGAIEQDADMVLFTYRPEYYGIIMDEDNNDLKGIGFIVIAKNREGQIKDVPFRYNESMTNFSDVE